MPVKPEKHVDAWMAALAIGDRSVFDGLFRELYPRALIVARRQLRDPEAHDAAQTALMRIFARAHEFEAGRPALPWFYATLGNELRTAVRRDRREMRRNVVLEHAHGAEQESQNTPEALLVEKELLIALEDAISRLDRTAAQAISALLGRAPPPEISDAAFRKRVSRAYLRLRYLVGGRR
jgi:RNA polymerase sigma factor (sigma-70 family)